MLSEAMRLIRVFHDLKQQDLADSLGVSKSHISEIESGKKSPSLDLVEKYSKFFGVPVSSIIFFSESIDDKSNKGADEKVRSAIAGKIVQFLRFIEARTDGKQEGLQPKG